MYAVAERRKKRPARDIILKTVTRGSLTVKNVPFVKADKETDNFYMEGNAMFKLADLLEYMESKQIKEFNFEDFEGK